MIQIIDGFNLQTSTPIDSRIVVADDTERTLITSTYPGLRIWQVDTNTPYFWDGGTDTWVSELDLVVTGVDGNVTDGKIPKFSSINPTKIEDSKISDDGTTVTIDGVLDVGGDLIFDGILDGDINADKITDGLLNLERLNVGSGVSDDVLQIDNLGVPKFVSLSGISIGSSSTSDQVKLQDVNNSNYYKFTLREDNTTALNNSFDLYSYTTDLLLSQSSNSMCILAHNGSKENPPYSFYNNASTDILGGMYYDNSISFSIDSEPKFKIKDDGVFINSSYATDDFVNVNTIGVPIGGMVMYCGDVNNIGNGDLWNFVECKGYPLNNVGTLTDPDGNSFTLDLTNPIYQAGGNFLQGPLGAQTPDLRDKFPLGTQYGSSTNGQFGGHYKIEDEHLPNHKHDSGDYSITSSGSHTHTWTNGAPVPSGSDEETGEGTADSRVRNENVSTDISNSGTHTHTSSDFTGNSGDGEFENDDFLPPFIRVTYIMRVI